MKWALVALFSVCAGMSHAQTVDADAVQSCFAEAGPGETAPLCIGKAADACLAGGSETTVAIVNCIQKETVIWDQILNTEYQAVRGALKAQDPALGDVLRGAQRAWIAYRDAECGLEFERWGGGTIRHIVIANCMMLETAERAIELRDKKGY